MTGEEKAMYAWLGGKRRLTKAEWAEYNRLSALRDEGLRTTGATRKAFEAAMNPEDIAAWAEADEAAASQ